MSIIADTSAFIDRIEKFNLSINAVVATDFENARKRG